MNVNKKMKARGQEGKMASFWDFLSSYLLTLFFLFPFSFSLFPAFAADTDNLSEKITVINLISDDEQKIKEWAKITSKENYLIINKKQCSAAVYSKEGRQIASFEVGIGRDIGDDFNDTKGIFGKPKNTTPAGEFKLNKNIINTSSYGDFTLSLGSKASKSGYNRKVVAMHKVPKFREKDRLKKFYDGDISNNRMSHGCINFLEDDFMELVNYIHAGLKAYVLPEEYDNHLILKKNNYGEFEFVQTKY